jgi:hypothetical protein
MHSYNQHNSLAVLGAWPNEIAAAAGGDFLNRSTRGIVFERACDLGVPVGMRRWFEWELVESDGALGEGPENVGEKRRVKFRGMSVKTRDSRTRAMKERRRGGLKQ